MKWAQSITQLSQQLIKVWRAAARKKKRKERIESRDEKKKEGTVRADIEVVDGGAEIGKGQRRGQFKWCAVGNAPGAIRCVVGERGGCFQYPVSVQTHRAAFTDRITQ